MPIPVISINLKIKEVIKIKIENKDIKNLKIDLRKIINKYTNIKEYCLDTKKMIKVEQSISKFIYNLRRIGDERPQEENRYWFISFMEDNMVRSVAYVGVHPIDWWTEVCTDPDYSSVVDILFFSEISEECYYKHRTITTGRIGCIY